MLKLHSVWMLALMMPAIALASTSGDLAEQRADTLLGARFSKETGQVGQPSRKGPG
jgi:hypothetical protein